MTLLRLCAALGQIDERPVRECVVRVPTYCRWANLMVLLMDLVTRHSSR